jgi:hypothetical protein
MGEGGSAGDGGVRKDPCRDSGFGRRAAFGRPGAFGRRAFGRRAFGRRAFGRRAAAWRSARDLRSRSRSLLAARGGLSVLCQFFMALAAAGSPLAPLMVALRSAVPLRSQPCRPSPGTAWPARRNCASPRTGSDSGFLSATRCPAIHGSPRIHSIARGFSTVRIRSGHAGSWRAALLVYRDHLGGGVGRGRGVALRETR